jgi:4-amino-4-deoxy-L-arabinose transferase-like glycosyltransferase
VGHVTTALAVPQSASMSHTDRAAAAPWLWAAIAVVLRIAWLLHQPPVPAWDGNIYARTAVRIAHGLGFVDTWNNLPPYHPTAFYPVGYPAVLGFAYAIVGVHPWVVGAINVLASAVSTYVAVLLARRAFGNVPAHVAGALAAFSPGAVLYTSAYMTEPVSAALLALAVVAGLAHARTRKWTFAVIAGLLLGAGALVRPPALLLAPALALAVVPAWDVRNVLRTLALVGFATALVVVPWTARNCRELDGCALVSVNGGSNLFIGTDPTAHGGYRDLRVGEGCDRVYGEVAKDRCYMRLALHRIAEHPVAWLELFPEKVSQLLDQETTPISYIRDATHGARFRVGADPWYRMLTSWHHLILGFAFVALVPIGRVRRRTEAVRTVFVVVTVIAVLIFVHGIFFGAGRYHFVFMPLVCTLAGGAFRRAEMDV